VIASNKSSLHTELTSASQTSSLALPLDYSLILSLSPSLATLSLVMGRRIGFVVSTAKDTLRKCFKSSIKAETTRALRQEAAQQVNGKSEWWNSHPVQLCRRQRIYCIHLWQWRLATKMLAVLALFQIWQPTIEDDISQPSIVYRTIGYLSFL